MNTRKERDSTEWMLKVVSTGEVEGCPNFPREFLCGLRGALEAGLSCEEITALLILFTGIYEASQRYSGEELIRRSVLLTRTMSGDIEYLNQVREQSERNKRFRQALIRRRGRKAGR